jgi:hypothetical protein
MSLANCKRFALSAISLLTLSVITLLFSACCLIEKCPDECDDFDARPDLTIPDYLPTPVTFSESRPHWVGEWFVGFGDYIRCNQGYTNEYYAVTRYDPIYGEFVFYWSPETPPPFGFVVYIGETIAVFKWIYNMDASNSDCNTNTAETSRTSVDVVIKIGDNLDVASQQHSEITTEAVPPGQVKAVVSHVLVTSVGLYDLKFNANKERVVPERDTTNNKYVKINSRNGGNVDAGRKGSEQPFIVSDCVPRDTVVNNIWYVVADMK